jgi:hypothetical protein
MCAKNDRNPLLFTKTPLKNVSEILFQTKTFYPKRIRKRITCERSIRFLHPYFAFRLLAPHHGNTIIHLLMTPK